MHSLNDLINFQQVLEKGDTIQVIGMCVAKGGLEHDAGFFFYVRIVHHENECPIKCFVERCVLEYLAMKEVNIVTYYRKCYM